MLKKGHRIFIKVLIYFIKMFVMYLKNMHMLRIIYQYKDKRKKREKTKNGEEKEKPKEKGNKTITGIQT